MSLSTLKGMDNSNDASSVESTLVRGPKIHWPGGPAIMQNFSLPFSIIRYIALNPSNPKVYNKLIQTCKYFFQRNPILVAATVTDTNICSTVEFYCNQKCCVKIDINKMTSKIWITGRLRFNQNNIPNFTALLRPKIYRCDIVDLKICETTVEFEDFKLFALSASGITLVNTQIFSSNGIPVMLENVLEALPNVEYFNCWFKDTDSMVSASTAKNMSKLKNFGSLKKLLFLNVPGDFKLDDLFTFFKDQNDIQVALTFASSISEHYKNQLDHLIDSLIGLQLSNGFIGYDGQNQEKRKILWERFSK